MSYQEHISSLLQQETVDSNNNPETVKDQVQRNEDGMTDDAAKASFAEFMNDVSSVPPTPETVVKEESRADRYARKFAEVVIPVSVGLAARTAAESAMYAGGPLVGAAVAGISGMASGAASAAVEMNSVKKTGEGAKEFYSQRVLKREAEREEARQASGVGGAIRTAWVAIKDYSTAAKIWAIESGFKVKDRNILIDNILLANNIDPSKPFYEQLERVNSPDLANLIKQLEVQSVLSGFAERKTMEEITKRIDLLVSANASFHKRMRDPQQAEAVLERMWVEAQQEIADVIGHTRMKYILTGAVDRGAKSAIYTVLMGGAIDSIRNLLQHKGDAVHAADLTSSHTEAADHVNEALKANDHNLNVVNSLKESTQVELDDKSRLLNMAEEHFYSSGGHESASLPDKLREFFGDNYENYIKGGGEGPGSRIDRLNVLQNFKGELEQRPELRGVVEKLAQSYGWKTTDMWRAIVMRAQYENGAANGALSRILEQIQNGTFRGDLNQGLDAAGNTGEGWTKLVEWAVNPNMGGSAGAIDGLGPINEETLNRMREELEQTQIKLNIFDSEITRLNLERINLLKQTLKGVVVESAQTLGESATATARSVIKQLANISNLYAGIVALAAAAEVESEMESNNNVHRRRRAPSNRRSGASRSTRAPSGGANNANGNSASQAAANRANSASNNRQSGPTPPPRQNRPNARYNANSSAGNGNSRTTTNSRSPNSSNGSARTTANAQSAGHRAYQSNTSNGGNSNNGANFSHRGPTSNPNPSPDRNPGAEPKRNTQEERYNPITDPSLETDWLRYSSYGKYQAAGMPIPDYYQTLGVDPLASSKEIKRSYVNARRPYELAATRGDAEATAKLTKLSEAYNVISKARKAYHIDYLRAGRTQPV